MKQLRAEKRRKNSSTPKTEESLSDNKTYSNRTYTIPIRVNSSLYDTLQESLDSLNTLGDYSYTSIADIIRKSLVAYQEGMELTEIALNSGDKITTSIRVDENVYKFHKKLPNRKKTEILERAVRTFIKEKF
jgi:predicted DNA-binding antitoxin AbrB/MazE fold protein